MKRWLLVAVAVGGLCLSGSCGLLFLGLLATDDAPAGSGGAARDCTVTIDGWQGTIGAGGVVLTKGELTAELPWSFAYTDALRSGDAELNVFRAALGERYEPGALQHHGSGAPIVTGPATERSTGRAVHVVFASGAMSGFTNPVALISPDEGALRDYANSPALDAIAQLNRFPLSCAQVEGVWKSGFHTAAERYAAGTGEYRGVESVAAWRELTLMSGDYKRVSSALLNGAFFKRTDSGSWSHDDWSLTLEPEGAEAIAFDASYVAVQRGFLLRLANKQYPADIEEFSKSE